MSEAPHPLVLLEGVCKSFGGTQVLFDIDLAVAPGEVVVVIGPSGSGKSTLCRCINRLETIESGRIEVDGRPLPAEGKELAALRADVGMVFQSFNLFAHKTILDNITLGPVKARGLGSQRRRYRSFPRAAGKNHLLAPGVRNALRVESRKRNHGCTRICNIPKNITNFFS